MSLAVSYAALILADDGVEITSDKLQTLLKGANCEVEPIYATLFAKALAGKDVKDLLLNVGGASSAAPAPSGGATGGKTSMSGNVLIVAPAAAAAEEKKEEKKEEEKEESDEDMGFGLFD